MESEEDEGADPITFTEDEKEQLISDLNGHLDAMRTCYKLMRTHGAELQQALTKFESQVGKSDDALLKLSQLICEKGALLGVAAKAMLLTCDSYINQTDSTTLKLIDILQYDVKRIVKLERMVQEVAKDHTVLERKTERFSRYVLEKNVSDISDDEDEDQRQSQEPEEKTLYLTPPTLRHSLTRYTSLHSHKLQTFVVQEKKRSLKDMQTEEEEIQLSPSTTALKKRRTRVPDRPNIPFSAWSVLKNSIGKDLSKIAMPVNLNEPITVLQRITEAFEYSELLDLAANIEDASEQIAYLAAFSISVFAPTATRTTKPFNPLLGETYEFDRTDDLGWRSISEQVSHHPPVSALHCEGRGWSFWQDFGMITKFRGKNIHVLPTGNCNCKFHKSGNAYTWNRPTTLVHNIIVGKMWMEQQGLVRIKGLDSAMGVHCELTYVPYSYFSSEPQKQVSGTVRDQNEVPRWLIKGKWDEKVEIASIEMPSSNGVPQRTGEFRLIWKINEPDPENGKYHFFTRFTCELNQLEPNVAPTDSRFRPDVRLMEDGFWDESNAEKLRLEQKQREKRKIFEAAHKRHANRDEEPLWFKRVMVGDTIAYEYKGNYWDAKAKQDWSLCPDLF